MNLEQARNDHIISTKPPKLHHHLRRRNMRTCRMMTPQRLAVIHPVMNSTVRQFHSTHNHSTILFVNFVYSSTVNIISILSWNSVNHDFKHWIMRLNRALHLWQQGRKSGYFDILNILPRINRRSHRTGLNPTNFWKSKMGPAQYCVTEY